MSNDFTAEYPGKIIFGNGSMAKLAENLPADAKILLVTGKSFAKSSQMADLEHILANFAKIHVADIGHEAPVEDVERLIDIGRKKKISVVVSIGGGSTIDAAKAAAAIIPAEGKCIDYFHGKRKLFLKGLFFAALPTTAGSGAEITSNAVLTESQTKIKKSIRDSLLIADLAIVDPVLTVSMTQETTASSGMDALTQAIESYICGFANSVTMALAENSVELLIKNLISAYNDGKDLVARNLVAQGSLLSAMSFSQSGLGAAHGLAHPIGSLLSVPHGKACAILLPHILDFNFEVCQGALENLAFKSGLENAEFLIRRIKKMKQAMNIPTDFSEYGLNPSHFEFILKNCKSRSMQTNPRKMSDKDILELLRKLCGKKINS